MLKGISPLIPPELLKILAEMGHGDEIVLSDANFPAAANGKQLDCASMAFRRIRLLHMAL